MSGIYTDLAMEARELAGGGEGISEHEEALEGMTVSHISILREHAARRIGKPVGEYITIDAPELKRRDLKLFENVSKKLASEIEGLMQGLDPKAPVLIVGLGNKDVTPDALGPRVVDKAYVTRHITEYLPELIDARTRPVCAIAPGVLGVTGVETMEIVKGVTERVKPALVIAIDALASRSTQRLCSTVQLTNTGVSPGAGIGNNRSGINRETLGVPVVAIGVPMVVYASTISQDTISMIASETGLQQDEDKLLEVVQRVISENLGPLIVTPKEVDALVDDLSRVLADGINLALHALTFSEVKELLS